MFNDGLRAHILSSVDATVRIAEVSTTATGDIELEHVDNEGYKRRFRLTHDEADELATVLTVASRRVRMARQLVAPKPTRRLKP